MRPVRTVEQIRAAEAAHGQALADGTLMDRASFGLAMQCCALLRAMRGRVRGARVVVLAGSGGNGGDALFAGARLAERGCRVDAVLATDRVHAPGLAALLRAGGWSHGVDVAEALVQEADLVLDGLVGIGAGGALRPPMDELAALTQDTEALVVAVDVPSGVQADTGIVLGAAVQADLTVTFAALTPGLLTGAGRTHAGATSVVDIGIDDAFADSVASGSIAVIEERDVAAWLPEPAVDDHKYRRGVVGLAAGSATYPGAGILAARAASSGLAGMVMSLRDTGIPDIVNVASVSDATRVTAWTAGSGWDAADGASSELLSSLIAADVPLVIDASATALLADAGMAASVAGRRAATVLTPHEGEFARFCAAPVADRIAAARAAAAQFDAVVLLKGPGTVIADPRGSVLIDDLGGPELAVAGSGDVLAGLLGATLATGLPALQAAAAATWLHSAAGRLAAEGGRPVTATALLAAIPDAVAWARRGRGWSA